MNQILINATHKEEVRVAVVKNKQLTELDIESNLNQKNKGNIYKGRISRVEESLEAVFVNYGKDRQGFLSFKEISSQYYPNGNNKEKLKISDIVKEGQEVIVQIEKEERGNKGAALTTYISLVGTYMIYMPTKKDSVNISKQVHANYRKNLQIIAKELNIPENTCIILRTMASGKSKEEIQWEVDYLSVLWKSIIKASQDSKAPFLIYKESNIVIRSIRDYLRTDIDSVIIDDLNMFKQTKEFISFVLPHYLHKIKFFNIDEKSLFNHMGIENQINNVFKREVSLKSGGTIVFDTAEALTAIDINSAKANKGINIEDTAYSTNIEASKEIAKQLQLRDVGGLIVIDFIDMNVEEHKKNVVNAMQKAVEKDRARTHIGVISNFGLLEMSRQRIRSSISEAINRTCDKCSGSGAMQTVPGLALQILRQLENNCNASNSTVEVIIKSTVEVITYLLNEKRNYILRLEDKHKVKIILLPHAHKQFPYYDIKKKTVSSKPEHKSYQGISRSELPDILTKKHIADIPAIDIYHPNKPLPTNNNKESIIKKIINNLFNKKPNKTKFNKTKPINNNRRKPNPKRNKKIAV